MRGFLYNTHNTYLKILFNLGAIGVSLYLVVLINILVSCRRMIPTAPPTVRSHLIAFFFGFVAMNISVFFVDLYKPWLYIWAYIGLVMRLGVSSMSAWNTAGSPKYLASTDATSAKSG